MFSGLYLDLGLLCFTSLISMGSKYSTYFPSTSVPLPVTPTLSATSSPKQSPQRKEGVYRCILSLSAFCQKSAIFFQTQGASVLTIVLPVRFFSSLRLFSVFLFFSNSDSDGEKSLLDFCIICPPHPCKYSGRTRFSARRVTVSPFFSKPHLQTSGCALMQTSFHLIH